MNVTGDGLGEFESEAVAHAHPSGAPSLDASTFVIEYDERLARTLATRASTIATPRIPDHAVAVSPLMAAVEAYAPRSPAGDAPPPRPLRDTPRASTTRPRPRWSVRKAARAIFIAPVVAVVRGVARVLWGAITATSRLIVSGLNTLVYGVFAVVAFTVSTVAGAAAALATLSHTVMHGLRRTSAHLLTGAIHVSASALAGAARGSQAAATCTAASSRLASAAALRAARMVTASVGTAAPWAGRRLVSLARHTARGLRTSAARAAAWEAPAAVRLELASLARGPRWRPQDRVGAMTPVALVVAVAISGGAVVLSRRPTVAPIAKAAPVEGTTRPTVHEVARTSAATVGPTRLATGRAQPLSGPRAAKRPAAGTTVNAAQIRGVWQNTDTSSLDRAFSVLRGATMALHRCEMHLTSADRAIAHCDEVREAAGPGASPPGHVTWTLDFRRSGARWLIEDVSLGGSRGRAGAPTPAIH